MSAGSPNPLIITLAPSPARAVAIASPMPEVEPVTRATLPSRIMPSAMTLGRAIATVPLLRALGHRNRESGDAARRTRERQFRGRYRPIGNGFRRRWWQFARLPAPDGDEPLRHSRRGDPPSGLLRAESVRGRRPASERNWNEHECPSWPVDARSANQAFHAGGFGIDRASVGRRLSEIGSALHP